MRARRYSGVEKRLLDELASPPVGTLTLELEVYCSGPGGPQRIAHGSMPISAPSTSDLADAADDAAAPPVTDMYMRRVALFSAPGEAAPRGGEEVGELRLTLLCADVLRAAVKRAHAQPSLSIGASQLCLAASYQADVAITSIWLEVYGPPALVHAPPAASSGAAPYYDDDGTVGPPPLARVPPLAVTPRMFATRGVLRLALDATVPLSPTQLAKLGALLHTPAASAYMPPVSPYAAPFHAALGQPASSEQSLYALPWVPPRAPLSRPASAARVHSLSDEEEDDDMEEDEGGAMDGAGAGTRASRFRLPTGLGRRNKAAPAAGTSAAKPGAAGGRGAVAAQENVPANAAVGGSKAAPLATTVSPAAGGGMGGNAAAARHTQLMRSSSHGRNATAPTADAGIEFVLRCDGYSGERTLGSGWVDLRQMLLGGEEKLLVGVELKDACAPTPPSRTLMLSSR